MKTGLIKLALTLLCFATPLAAQELSFSAEGTEACLNRNGGTELKMACVGTSANICINSEGGYSTVGMGYCFAREAEYWDARLNDVYRELRASEEADDAEIAEMGMNVPKKAEALRNMQRAWMAYRDAVCAYEYSQWGGGTGGGPANAACLMEETARQTLTLEERLAGRMQ